MTSFKVTEEALEQEVAAILADRLACEYSTQGGVEGGQFDVLLTIRGYTLVIELKIGKGWARFAEGIAQANGYKEKLNADGIIALMYPETARRMVTCEEDIRDIVLGLRPETLILSPFLNDHLDVALVDVAEKISANVECAAQVVTTRLIVDALRDCVQALATKLKRSIGVAKPAIDEVVGRFDLFRVLAGEDGRADTVTERDLKAAACDLAAYVLINQVLLYHLLSDTLGIPALTPVSNIQELHDSFRRVTNINYKAVYSVELASKFPESAVREVNFTIEALKAVKPERVPHDLLGRVFHEFLPFETRKVLGAFYTKPVAAEILAGLAVDEADDTVIDPACGSGTLLVAAYKRKQLLDPRRSHSTILEKDIMGIDVMPFAAHLSALNLTLQDTRHTTDRTRIGIANSLDLQRGAKLGTLPEWFTLFAEKQPAKTVSVDRLHSQYGTLPIPETVDLVIMNPPFTRKERLGPGMTGQFADSFEQRQNYWAYFLAWADSLLDKGGKVAAVLPRDFFAGQHSAGVREWLFGRDNYRIRFVVKTVNEVAFSEDAKFRDFLVVLEKGSSRRKTALVYLTRRLEDTTVDAAHRLVDRVTRSESEGSYEDDDVAVSWVDSSSAHEDAWTRLCFSHPHDADVLIDFHRHVLDEAGTDLVALRQTGIGVIRGLEPVSKGMLNAVFGVRPLDKHRIERSVLIIQREDERTVTMGLKGLEKLVTAPRANLVRGLKTPSYLPHYDVGKATDWVVVKRFSGFEKVEKLEGVEKIHFHSLLEQASRRRTHLAVSRKIDLSAPGTRAVAFFSDSDVLVGKAFWAFDTKPLYSKAICLWLNSAVSFLQLLLERTETRGSYSELTKDGLFNLRVPAARFIDAHSEQFTEIFDSISHADLPPLIQQFDNPAKERIFLDTMVLELLGFPKREIKRTLPAVYGAIANELNTMKQAMRGGGRQPSAQEQIW